MILHPMKCLQVNFSSVTHSKKIKVFSEAMICQKIEVTPYNLAFYYTTYGPKNEVNTSKIHNYFNRNKTPYPERIQTVIYQNFDYTY